MIEKTTIGKIKKRVRLKPERGRPKDKLNKLGLHENNEIKKAEIAPTWALA